MRLRNPAARKGKRGGFRVIYYVYLSDHIYLLTIYAKTAQENVPVVVIRALIESIAASSDDPP